jgi:hypothetical protein
MEAAMVSPVSAANDERYGADLRPATTALGPACLAADSKTCPLESGHGSLEGCSTHPNPALAGWTWRVHTPLMTLKNAAFLALVGTALLLVLLAAGFVNTLLGVLRGIAPAMALLPSLIHLLATLSVVVFLFEFHKAQS